MKILAYSASHFNPCFAISFHEKPTNGGLFSPVCGWQLYHHQLVALVFLWSMDHPVTIEEGVSASHLKSSPKFPF